MRLPVALLALTLSTAVPGLAARSIPSPPGSRETGVQRVKEFVHALNSPDRSVLEAFFQRNYSPELLRTPLAGHLGFADDFRSRNGRVVFHGIQSAGDTEVAALVRSTLTDEWDTVAVQLEASPPYRIAAVGRVRAEPPPGAQTEAPRSDRGRVAALKAFMDRLGKADWFSGTVLVAKGEQVLFAKSYGEADKDFHVRNRLDTRYNLASVGKMFTAVAVAQLVEAAKLRFDDPLSRYLPDFPTPEGAGSIRIEHLLTHTSGLGDFSQTRRFAETSRDMLRSVADYLQFATEEKPAFDPGTRWAYSNTGYLVLGAVIEKVTGMSYQDYVREHIFQRAGMLSTDNFDVDLVVPNLAVGYHKEFPGDGIRFHKSTFVGYIRGEPFGGACSTAGDLLQFANALRNDRLVGSQYRKLLLSAKPALGSPDYGYGFEVDRQTGTVGHGGRFPGVSTFLSMFPEAGYTAVVLSNYSDTSLVVIKKIRSLFASTAR
jgi:CubicO group peptidase (beta-lactamase class C family)